VNRDATESTRNSFPTTSQTWDLESLYPGGADSEVFEAFTDDLDAVLDVVGQEVEALEPLSDTSDKRIFEAWAAALDHRQRAQALMREAMAYTRCLSAAHADDPQAQQLHARVSQLYSKLEQIEVTLQNGLRETSDEALDALLERDELDGMELYVRELRRDAGLQMDFQLESLAVDLNEHGLHRWGQLYDRVTGEMEVTVEEADSEGSADSMSVGQAKNLLSDSTRATRRAAFDGLQRAWEQESTVLAATLDGIVGSLETLYERRGYDELTGPLNQNRIERSTLEALLEAAESVEGELRTYLELKADAVGVDRLEWYDRQAPVGETDDAHISWEDAQSFVVENIEGFSEPMAEFYRHALSRHWVEAEDRSGKGQGAFCSTLPVSNEIRVFMTYGGSMSNLLTLAHELGHAWHGWLMRDLPASARNVPMTLAESASTLSEKLVESAALQRAEGDRELHLLDERLQRATTFLLDIPARFRLERAMHREARRGSLTAEKLGEMAVEAFRSTFGDAVASFDTHFWASKLHYFITRLRFYNFPYSFGYLFSKGLYQRATGEGPLDADTIDDLLVDSGRYTAEDLAQRYLGADLGTVDFWKDAVADVGKDVARYQQLV
jgi:pepF/M3 family oligoendopeptidase